MSAGSAQPTSRRRRWILAAALVVAVLVVVAVAAVVRARGASSTVRTLPSVPGVTAALYDLGDSAVTTSTGTEQLTAAVYYPTDLTGTHRIVLLQHGTHTPCADPTQQFPCTRPEDRADSFLGYGYLGEALALKGYVVVSISAERTIASADSGDEGYVANAHLALWRTWATEPSGPFGGTFVGHVDLGSIGVAGHSRGGEAMARYAAGAAGPAPAVPVAGVLLLAPAIPVDGSPLAAPKAPTAVVLGTCDGDVGAAAKGYARTAGPQRTLVLVRGANHNFFNTRWTPGAGGLPDAVDDADRAAPGCAPGSPTRLTPAEQQRLASSIAVTFFDAAFAPRSTQAALTALATKEPALTVEYSR